MAMNEEVHRPVTHIQKKYVIWSAFCKAWRNNEELIYVEYLSNYVVTEDIKLLR